MRALNWVSKQRSRGEAICIPFAPHLYPLDPKIYNNYSKLMAERVGFEPTVPVLAAHTISSRVPSASSDISPRISGARHRLSPGSRAAGPAAARERRRRPQ
jgi:hypothetical protein